MADSGARVLAVRALLGSRPWSTAEQTAGRLEVTTRTVRRDIVRLREMGYPVVSLADPAGRRGPRAPAPAPALPRPPGRGRRPMS